MGISSCEVTNKKIDAMYNRSKIHSKKNIKHSTVKNNNINLRIFHQNICGLHNKVDELTIHWGDSFPHFLCISEHHLRDYEIGKISINQYNLGAFYCREKKKQGGVGIFVHNTLNSSNIELNRYCNENDLEACALKTKLANEVYHILCIYRPPTSNYANFQRLLEDILTQLFSNTTNLIICGDINIDYLKTSNQKSQLDFLMASYNLSSIIEFPTRVSENTSTAIDNIFIDKLKNNEYTVEPMVNGLSDHDAQLLTLYNRNGNNQEKLSIRKRIINSDTIAQFKVMLSYENWSTTFEENNIDISFQAFVNTYIRNFYHCFPYKKVLNNYNKKAWITKGIKTSCQKKRDLYNLCKTSQDTNLKQYYKKYTKILTDVIKIAKHEHYNKIYRTSKNKTKTMWNFIKSESNMYNNKNEIQLNIEGKQVTNPMQLANIFNDYFTNATTMPQLGNYNDPMTAIDNLLTSCTKSPSQIHMAPVTGNEIKKIIKSLKMKSSCGYDEVPPKILKISLPYIISPLVHLCNRSLHSGIFPSWLKYAQIVPIFKKGDKEQPTNYRPITLLTSFSKIFEKVIYTRLENHINVNNILASEQYGFRSNTSIEQAIYQLTNNILKALDNKQLVGGIFCDLTKAFDCVDHKILLNKLEFYGITGNANKLLKSYLTERYQRVTIRNKASNTYFSKWNKITKGIPQGSVLGPLLFLIYINDLPGSLGLNSLPTLFADDTNIICTHHDLHSFKENVEESIIRLTKWFKANLLTLNLEKTKFVQFVTKPNQSVTDRIGLDHHHIGNARSISFLGLILDDTLTWHLHIDKICTKIKTGCYVLRSLKSCLLLDNLKLIYFSYIHSIITYGIIFWGNSSKSHVVFKLQKRAIRIITNTPSKTSCRDLFKELNILPLKSQYILSLLMYVSKNLNDFTFNSDNHPINTRHKTHLHPPLLRLSRYQKAVYYTGIKLFNSLPSKLKDMINSKTQFKKELKKFLLHGSFYTIDEYHNWASNPELHNLY
jgi:exonuclease III